MSDLRLLGYPARLTIELEDGEHDISRLLESAPMPDMGLKLPFTGWQLSATLLANEIQIEERARELAKGRQEKAT